MTVCLLLAAGSSSRMGKPKMLLPFNEKPLLQHVIDEVKKTNDTQLLVVTGCFHDLIKEIVEPQQVAYKKNEQWEQGMGSSIAVGIQHIIERYPGSDNAIILVCDQPYLSCTILSQLISTQAKKGKGIVACTYNKTTGTPVLFNKKYFQQLALLKGQSGAKKLVEQFADDVVVIPFPEGAIDIDTPEDYASLTNS